MQSKLATLSEKAVHQPVIEDAFRYCPSMDLLAVATEDQQVLIFRLTGEKVSGYSQRGSQPEAKQIRLVKWKPNGKLLAIGSSNGSVRLLNADHCKIIHQINSPFESNKSLTCIGWTSIFANGGKPPPALNSRIDSGYATDGEKDLVLNLPRSLSLIDIEGSLPKLSCVPAIGSDDDVFSTRSSIDSIFHGPVKTVHEAIDVLLLGFEDGMLYLLIYDTFIIGSFDSKAFFTDDGTYNLLLHVSNAYDTTHSLLLTSSGGNNGLYFVPMDLRFIFKLGDYLPLLAAKSTQLQNLLRYLLQVQISMHHEWKAAQDLPSRLMQNVDEALEQQCYCNFVHAAYHLAVTGDCYPPMKEWLVDELMERGHSRWDKAILNGYDNVRRLGHESLLPCLERCSVVASRLRGLARYEEANSSLGLSSKALNEIISTINCLIILAHTILRLLNSEQERFVAFSGWLRHQITVQSSDVPGANADESLLKEGEFDYHKILSFIQGPLVRSKLASILDDEDLDSQSIWSSINLPATLNEDFKVELKKFRDGQFHKSSLLNLIGMGRCLQRQSHQMFGQVAESQRRNILFGSPIHLRQDSSSASIDMRACKEDGKCVTYIALPSVTHGTSIHMIRITLEIENGVTASRHVEAASLFSEEGQISQYKFADDSNLLCLWESDLGSHHLVSLPYSKIALDSIFKYEGKSINDVVIGHESLQTTENSNRLSSTTIQDQFMLHTFDEGFVPSSIEINGRPGRKVACVLSKDRVHYMILDLDGGLDDVAEKASANSA
ncbi:MAG: hypothetical protein M1814_004305 [Vezdaea aestivalis]|nr:MAG: hypothetical protein M1814_004305 [Vezdaea aestivalis]